MKIAMVGLGVMGKPMAENLIKNGFELTIYARRPEVCEEMKTLGAHSSPSVWEAASQCDVFITLMPNGQALEEILFAEATGAINGLREGSLVIDMGTTSPSLTRRVCKELYEKSIGFLGAPISGGVGRAAAGTLTVMCGGKYEDFERALPIFNAVGENIYHTGDIASAQTVKLINNMVACTNIAALCEGIALAERAGVDARLLVDIMDNSSGQSYATSVKARQFILPRKFENAAKATIYNKDLTLVLEMASEYNLPLSLAEDTRRYLRALIDSGRGALDASAIILNLETMSAQAQPDRYVDSRG